MIWVRAEDDGLMIRIEASDVAALRAASNSYLRWVAAILDVVETVQ
jgi:tRNA threonylcarbamoyladenosine modification (KEOPS) complex  Pcc1 subunit